MRCDERERAGRGRAVVVGEPERELDERRGDAVDDGARVRDLDPVGSLDTDVDDDAAHASSAEPDRDDVARVDLVGDAVGEGPRQRAGVTSG